MSTNEPVNIIQTKTTYTFNEAIEYMRNEDKNRTIWGKKTIWVNNKTKERVTIGYTSH